MGVDWVLTWVCGVSDGLGVKKRARTQALHDVDGHLVQALDHGVDRAVAQREEEVGEAPLGVDAEDEDKLRLNGRVGSCRVRGVSSFLLCRRQHIEHQASCTWRQSIRTMMTIVTRKMCRQLNPIRQKR